MCGRIFQLILLLVSLAGVSHAQNCPPNIDFETGSFNGWNCYVGNVAAVGTANVISLYSSGPEPDRHTMYSVADIGTVDPYGGFPVLCPNGSGHSIRLGNSFGGGQAEGISYEFTIPITEDKYSMIYNYAVVFQDPNHQQYQQPRMEIEIMNVTDNVLIDCSSFTFVPVGTPLPGFFESPNPGSPTPVWCKDWTAVTINLDNLAGKRIRLFFKTADCTFTRHFGYAYIDVNSECSNTFLGATFCPDDTAVNVVAPFGYASYTWYDSTLVNILGTQQVLTLDPPPTAGTSIAVKVQPYAGYGCEQILYARMYDTLTVVANAGPDILSCNKTPMQLGVAPKPGVVYQWQPSTGLSRPNISNPFATPSLTTSYILTARHDGGGCVNRDTVLVTASIIDSSMQLIGKNAFCIDSDDSAVLRVQPTDQIVWYKDNIVIAGASGTEYRVKESGSYFALLRNKDGCIIATKPKSVYIELPKPGLRYPVQYAVENFPIDLQARDFGVAWLWSPATYLSSNEIPNPTFTGSREQLYTIQITTTAGCVTIDTLLVRTVKNVDIQVPTAFTPNGDGLNDYLSPTLMGVKQLRYFRVYNRWGQLLFESNREKPGWNGKVKGVLQSSSAVVWVAEGVGLDGKTYIKKGTSVLIR